jgi:putative transcriptional regulator
MLVSFNATNISQNPEEPVYNRSEEARSVLGLTRQDLVDEVGKQYQTIGYLQRNKHSPSLVLALRISKILNEEISEIFILTLFKLGK